MVDEVSLGEGVVSAVVLEGTGAANVKPEAGVIVLFESISTMERMRKISDERVVPSHEVNLSSFVDIDGTSRRVSSLIVDECGRREVDPGSGVSEDGASIRP
jgi:hypothetical protein